MNKIKNILKESKALMTGHFLLTSGLHSGHYVEKFRLLEKPEYATQVFDAMAEPFKKDSVDIVVGPAVGGIIIAYGVAERLGCKYAFLEREKGKLVLRIVSERDRTHLRVVDPGDLDDETKRCALEALSTADFDQAVQPSASRSDTAVTHMETQLVISW